MSAELLQALIAAGVKPSDAGRVAKAVEQMVRQGPAASGARSSQFSRPPGTGYQAVSGKKDTFALYASAPQTNTRTANNTTLFGPGGGALGVEGVSVFDGEIYCSDSTSVGDLLVRGGAAVAGGLAAKGVRADRTLSVGASMTVDATAASVTVPLRANSTLSVAGGTQLDVQTTLNGRIDIQGQVFWRGLQNPSVIDLLSVAQANGGDTLTLVPNTVTVLSDHGVGKQVQMKYAFVPTTKAITYVTDAVFDEETCSITTTTETTEVVTGGEITVSLVEE